MKKIAKEFLKLGAKVSEKLAVKSCGATSLIDTYQPAVPAEVRKLKMQKKQK